MTHEDKQKLAAQIAEKAMSFKNVTYAVVLKAVYEALNARDEEMKRLRNPWISVEDRLPAEFKTVIVMFDSGIIINAFVTMVKDEPAWHPSVEIPIGSDVIFWMPIPKPILKKGGEG